MSTRRNKLAIVGMLLALAAGAATVFHVPRAAAQPAAIKPAGADDLRAAFANAADVAEGKRLAEASCAAVTAPTASA